MLLTSLGVGYDLGLGSVVLDAHPIVSAQSQLRTCEGARPKGGSPTPW